MDRFAHELEAVGAKVRRATRREAVHAALREEIRFLNARRIVTWARSEFAGLGVGFLWDELGARAVGDSGLDQEDSLRGALLEAEVGVTTVQAAVAATGSLVVSAAPGRPRAVSLLPTVHLALVKKSQIVPVMGAAFSHVAGGRGLPSAIHFISGPSRTSDIENDLTIGVHGPAMVIVVIWEGS